MKLSLRALVPALVAGACAVGCAAGAAGDESTGADLAPIVQPRVHVIDAEPGKDLDVGADQISGPAARLADLATYAPGDVIVSGRAGGLLRRVRATRVEGDRVVVDTEAASLEDVFHQVHLRGSIGDPPAQGAGPGLAPRGVKLALPKMHVDNRRLTIGNNGSEIEVVDGNFSFEPQLDFDLTMQGGKLDHLKVVASGETEGNLHLRYELHRPAATQSGAFVSLDDGIPVVESAPYYAVFWAGWVPVVVTVRARLLASWELHVGGDVFGEESVRANGSVAAGLEYAGGGWRNVASKSISVGLDGHPTVVSHALSGDVNLTARLDVSFYELAGPYVGLQAYAGVGHQGSDDGSGWFTECGLRGIAGAEASVFGKALVGYQAVLFDLHEQQPL